VRMSFPLKFIEQYLTYSAIDVSKLLPKDQSTARSEALKTLQQHQRKVVNLSRLFVSKNGLRRSYNVARANHFQFFILFSV
jgi:hypothetical protein